MAGRWSDFALFDSGVATFTAGISVQLPVGFTHQLEAASFILDPSATVGDRNILISADVGGGDFVMRLTSDYDAPAGTPVFYQFVPGGPIDATPLTGLVYGNLPRMVLPGGTTFNALDLGFVDSAGDTGRLLLSTSRVVS